MGNSSGVSTWPTPRGIRKIRLGRYRRAGGEDEAVAFQPIRRQHGEPSGSEDRPWAHCDDDRIAGDRLAIDFDALDNSSIAAKADAGGRAEAQIGAPPPRHLHHRHRKLARIDAGDGLGRAEALVDRHRGGQPIDAKAIALPVPPSSAG